MKRITLLLSLLLTLGLAAAQSFAPTQGEDEFDVSDSSGASIDQTISVTVPEIFALHFDTTFLDFDLTNLVNQGDVPGTSDGIICVYGYDIDGGYDTGSAGNNGWIAGTQYTFETWEWTESSGVPNVEIVTQGGSSAEQVVDWPRVVLDSDGELVEKDRPIVCYRAFTMQKYTNSVDGWDLSVESSNDIEGVNLYIQDNTRCLVNLVNGAGLGTAGVDGIINGVPLKPLHAGDPLSLMSNNATTWGYDGDSVSACGEAGLTADHTGWLDDLTIVALEFGLDTPAMDDEQTTLTYTLMPFGN